MPPTSSITRHLSHVRATPAPAPGFIGPGHLAVEVVGSEALDATDPFVLLMDDRLDIPVRRQIGGAHPHAGLETVTLVLEGTLHDRDEGTLAAGDALWMTAGRGIIHNEHVEAIGRSRILQLWIRLSATDRALAPSFEHIPATTIPIRREPGAIARLYSGRTGDRVSPTRNRAPITLVDITLEPSAQFTQELPSSYNGFVYALDGDATVEGTCIAAGSVGWIDRPTTSKTDTTLTFVAGPRGARVVLYAGEPQREPLVHHGPFVAGNEEEIRAFYRRFRTGDFTPMSSIARTHAHAHALAHALALASSARTAGGTADGTTDHEEERPHA